MPKILLIETATEVCSAAIAVDGRVVAIEEASDTNQHAALLTLQIESCVRRSGITLADLDAVAVSRGPGSYTSLRVGASVAKGICYALDKPLLAIDTLEALANASREWTSASLQEECTFVPMLDARRQEVWTAVFDAGMRLLAPPQPLILENNLFETLARTAGADLLATRYVFSGNGSIKAESVIFAERMVWSPIKKASANFLSALAERHFESIDFQNIAYYEPFYMKPPNITIPNRVL
jgi:tRNA threonylcarbamoyladenosine biosynthesis protein TsaB